MRVDCARSEHESLPVVSGHELRELHAGYVIQRRDEPAPVSTLGGQRPSTGVGDSIVATPPLAGFLDSSPLDPAAVFHAVQRRVQRCQREREVSARPLLDQLCDLYP